MRKYKFHKPSKRTYIIFAAILVILAILAYGFYAYLSWANRQVYSSNEQISFEDFSIKMVDYSYIEQSGIPTKDIFIDGKIKSPEACPVYARTSMTTPIDWVKLDTERVCRETNSKIDIYNAYEPLHKKIALNFEITAKKNVSVDMAELKTYINVPSGRDITQQINFPDDFAKYTPYGVSSKDGYLHSELSRKINMWADLKNDENVVDIVVIYRDQQRIYRLSL